MNLSKSAQTKPSAAARAEAALWLAHLRSPERDGDVERGFRLWLEAKPEHSVAFELATDIWERTAAVRRHPHEQNARWSNPDHRNRPRILAIAAALSLVLVGSTIWYLQRNSVTTDVGEQRTITLEDGSRIFLNTDTRAVVQYDSHERRIQLDKGEALFEVAREPRRPFIVAAGLAQVQALGTSFVVRRDQKQLAITLVEGEVSVASTERHKEESLLKEPKMLRPGERLTIAPHSAPVFDAPVLDKLTAWQRGQVAFDSVPLADAVAEMNRYSATKIVVERPEAAAMQIGGIFRTGDASSFADAMAETYRFEVIEDRGRIVLSGIPKAPERSDRRPK